MQNMTLHEMVNRDTDVNHAARCKELDVRDMKTEFNVQVCFLAILLDRVSLFISLFALSIKNKFFMY